MNISNEILTTMINGGICEIFVILSMYSAFEIMLHIEKKKIFFSIFFLDMLVINMMVFYMNYYGQDIKYSTLIIAILQLINWIIYLATLKVLCECSYLHIFLADIIAEIIGTVIGFGVYSGMAGVVGRAQTTFISAGFTSDKIWAFIGALVIMITLILVERFLLKRYLSDFYQKQIKWKGLWWGIVVVFSCSGLIVTAIYKGDIIFIITEMVMIILSVLVLYEVSWWVRRRREKQIKKENQILSIENAVMKEYYDTLEYQLERTRKFRHDIEKHMTVLKEMISVRENGKELMNYAAQIEEQYSYLQTIDYCGNPVVNAILVNKKHQCEEHRIEMLTEIGAFDPGEIKEIDLIAVISNLLDNAMEASIKSEKGKIVFKCSNKASNLFFVVRNTVNEETIVSNKEKGRTWKKDTYAHGVGLAIVQEIVEKYDGLFDMKLERGMCEVTVVLKTL